MPERHSGFPKKTGDFVSSTYYYDQYPAWVRDWNKKRLPDSYEGKSWELLQDRSKYVYRDTDDRPYETALPGYGRVFPHPFDNKDNGLFYTLLKICPVGDELTLEFAKNLIENEHLGQDDVPDYLAISFSSTDYVGHIFGIAMAVSSSDLRSGLMPEAPLIQQIRRNFHPQRSGDIYLVQESYWFLYSDETVPLCTIHGSPWRYDTYVPIIFAGAGVPAQRINSLVHPVDIASTLSAWMGAKNPSAAAGKPLLEVLN
jgi:hypothetical protein